MKVQADQLVIATKQIVVKSAKLVIEKGQILRTDKLLKNQVTLCCYGSRKFNKNHFKPLSERGK